LRKLVNHLI
jgi:hypothetical protein